MVSADTVVSWGYRRGVALEYSKFTDKPLSKEQWDLISDFEIGLVDNDNMFKFAIDVSNDKNLEYYQNLYGNVDVKDLLRVIQYLVQDSLLGGIYMTRPFSELINGYWDPNLEFLKEGDF